MYCAPDKEHHRISCFTKQSLVKIAKSYNKSIPGTKKIKIANQNKKQLWGGIRDKLSRNCNTEWCWIDQEFVKKNEKF